MSKKSVDTYEASWWSRLTQSRYFVYILISPLFLILFAYVIYPFYSTFIQSFAGDNQLANYQKFFSLESTANLEALWNSFYISIISVICCAVVGVMMAFLLERYDFPGRRLLSILVLVPMALPPLVGFYPFHFYMVKVVSSRAYFSRCFNWKMFRLP